MKATGQYKKEHSDPWEVEKNIAELQRTVAELRSDLVTVLQAGIEEIESLKKRIAILEKRKRNKIWKSI
jgi:hypothetical protein